MQTLSAIEEFQRRIVQLRQPDGRVDPNGRTWFKLFEGFRRPTADAVFQVAFHHHSTIPPSTSAPQGTQALYESTVRVTNKQSRVFRGSIYPDDMSIKGRLKDGTYDLYLGFHKRRGHSPSTADLEARSQGFRAALVVNADRPVAVQSDNPNKKTSEFIHIHNGYSSKRFSDGCPTIHPSDWPKFIRIFLAAYPHLEDWTKHSSYLGKKIGTLQVTS